MLRRAAVSIAGLSGEIHDPVHVCDPASYVPLSVGGFPIGGERERSATEGKSVDLLPRVMLDRLIAVATDAAWQPQAGVSIELIAPATPLWVRVDPDLIARVVHELVSNARDAVAGCGCVRVAVEQVRLSVAVRLAHSEFDTALPPDSYARLSVSDDGPGVPSEIKARLFEPFVSTKQHSPGRGLGLATVYGIARAVGWWLDVESVPGRTVFSVYLSLADEDVIS